MRPPICARIVALLAVLPLLVSCAGNSAMSATKTLQAGPFTLEAPRALAKNVIVERVPKRPYYATREAADEARRLDAQNIGDAKAYFEKRPEHWAIRFPALIAPGGKFDRKTAGEDLTAPQILIHNAGEWDAVFRGGTSDKTKNAEEIRNYVRALDEWGRRDGIDYPGPPYHDGYLLFTCLKKKIRFQGGYGYRAVAQWAIEPGLVERGALAYLFFGISDDQTCEVLASLPVDCPGLPAEGRDATHLGYSMRDYARLSKEFARYDAAARRWLVQRARQFAPSLETLDAMIGSLDARTWK